MDDHSKIVFVLVQHDLKECRALNYQWHSNDVRALGAPIAPANLRIAPMAFSIVAGPQVEWVCFVD
jgi:hypothetical protein